MEDAEEVREREEKRLEENFAVLILSCCRVILDGFSTFVVNPDGLIAVHKMDRVEPITIVTSTEMIIVILQALASHPSTVPHTHTHTHTHTRSCPLTKRGAGC